MLTVDLTPHAPRASTPWGTWLTCEETNAFTQSARPSTVSPRGGLVLCEDGGGDEYLHGLTVNGELFPFALNNVKLAGERNGLTGDFTSSEWAGPCFSPEGKWLFANLLDPRITVAITGRWQAGAL